MFAARVQFVAVGLGDKKEFSLFDIGDIRKKACTLVGRKEKYVVIEDEGVSFRRLLLNRATN